MFSCRLLKFSLLLFVPSQTQSLSLSLSLPLVSGVVDDVVIIVVADAGFDWLFSGHLTFDK